MVEELEAICDSDIPLSEKMDAILALGERLGIKSHNRCGHDLAYDQCILCQNGFDY